MEALADRIARKLRERLHLRATRAVLDTPPVKPLDDGVILFSMIGTRVLLPYLVAIKSLHAHLRRGRIAILDDGSLTRSDRSILARHLGDPEIRHIADVDTGPCPRGGTWERLLTLLDLRRDSFVIQLDSDTVTLGPVPEVAEAIGQGRSFTLRGEATSEFLPAGVVAGQVDAAYRRDNPQAHVQDAIESSLAEVEIPGRQGLRYIRGCSGFAGFAPSPAGRELAEQFSAAAQRLLGARRWAEWGSEQVTSNFVIANEPDPLALPYDRFLNFWNEPIGKDAAVVHFIGTYRFHRGAYKQATRRAISALQA